MEKTLVYDGDCKLCSGFAGSFEYKASKAGIKHLSFASYEDTSNSEGNTIVTSPPGSVIYESNGIIYLESDAIIRYLSDLGGVWNLIRIFQVFPLSLRNWIYRIIARNRHRIS